MNKYSTSVEPSAHLIPRPTSKSIKLQPISLSSFDGSHIAINSPNFKNNIRAEHSVTEASDKPLHAFALVTEQSSKARVLSEGLESGSDYPSNNHSRKFTNTGFNIGMSSKPLQPLYASGVKSEGFQALRKRFEPKKFEESEISRDNCSHDLAKKTIFYRKLVGQQSPGKDTLSAISRQYRKLTDVPTK